MNGRMSVKIDAALVGRAKRAALLRRKSLSGVVEDSLRAALDEPTRVGPSFADRWRGRFAVVENNPEDRRLMALKTRHRLP